MNTTTTAMDKVVAAVVAASADQKVSNVSTLAWETELPVREIRAAVRQAVAERRIRCGASTALGAYYYAA